MTKTIHYETVQKIRYIADDGSEFEKEFDCKTYERNLAKEVEKIRWKQIFGEAYMDYATYWCENRGECWYDVTIKSEDDLIDFLNMTKNIDAPFVEERFTNEVLETLNRGEEYTMLLYSDPEGNYMNRFGRCALKKKEQYEKELEMIANLEKLAANFRKYLRYEPEEEGENK